MRKIRIGSRESKLAVIQAEIVMNAVKKTNPEIEFELVPMKTTGDKILDRTLDKVGGKGLFIKELDEALAKGRIDICAHSYKDMPVEDNPDFPVVAVSKREDPRDVLVLPKGVTEIDFSKPVGCSSLRRKVQLAEIYPEWECTPVRGNVLTRLAKLDSGLYGGLVLAASGVIRLGLQDRIHLSFPVDTLLPSACQGIVAVQGRKGDDFTYLEGFNDKDAWDISTAERAFNRTLDGGCSSPMAAYGEIEGERLLLKGMYVDSHNQIYKGEIEGHRRDADMLGKNLAMQLKVRGE